MIYEGLLFGPISLVSIDTNNDLSGVMNQMGEQNEKDKSLNVLQTEAIEIDITREELKPLNPACTMFAVDKKDPFTVYLSECLYDEYILMCDGKNVELSDVLGMIYNKQEMPIIQAIQMDVMLPHENSIAMQRLWNEGGEVNNNQELSFLKNKTVVIDIIPEMIEKIPGYDNLYMVKQQTPVPEPAMVTPIPFTPETPIVPPVYTPPVEQPIKETTPYYNPAQEQPQAPAGILHDNHEPSRASSDTLFDNYESPRKNTTENEIAATSEYTPKEPRAYTEPSPTKAPEQEIALSVRFERDVPKRNKKGKAAKRIRRFLTSIFGWCINIALIIVAVYIISTYVLINAEIPSESMSPTIEVGDKIIGNRLIYTLETPDRGDIAIFKNPDNPEELYIKRIIGLPGEKITIKDGKIYIDDATEPLNEPYLTEEWTVRNDGLEYEVPEGCYFMLGDNRNVSYDARYWVNTFVPKEYLVAEAVFRYFPMNHATMLNEGQNTFYVSTNGSEAQ